MELMCIVIINDKLKFIKELKNINSEINYYVVD